jgi:hypothetical protein
VPSTATTADLGIVIPLSGDDRVDALLEQLAPHAGECRIIVSAVVPPPAGLTGYSRWLTGPAGRGTQLNLGTRSAGTRWLWFVHADSRLESDTFRRVVDFTAGADSAIGYCRLRFDGDGPRLVHLNALGANLRSAWLRQPYGDQGLCMPDLVHSRLGGFREDLDRGEDLDLVVRARLAGIPIRCTGGTIATSARRYRERGWLKTTWQHQLAATRLIRNARREHRSDSP